MTVVIPLNDFLTESNEAEYNIFLLMRAVSGHQQTRNTRVLKKMIITPGYVGTQLPKTGDTGI